MGIYNVDNPHTLINQAGNLGQLAQNILRVQEELSMYSYQISAAWQSDTEDKESYLKTIKEDLKKLETLCAALKALSNNLNAYAESAIATKANTYKGQSGNIV